MTLNTLYDLVRHSVKEFASRIAFSMFDGEDVTYAEVGRRIAKVQDILTGAGLRPGDKVALLSSNMPNWGVCYYAVTSASEWAIIMSSSSPVKSGRIGTTTKPAEVTA